MVIPTASALHRALARARGAADHVDHRAQGDQHEERERGLNRENDPDGDQQDPDPASWMGNGSRVQYARTPESTTAACTTPASMIRAPRHVLLSPKTAYREDSFGTASARMLDVGASPVGVEEGISPASAELKPGPGQNTSRDLPEGVGSSRIFVSQPETVGVADRPECFQGVSSEVVLLRLVDQDCMKRRRSRCVFRAAEAADGIAAQWKAAVLAAACTNGRTRGPASTSGSVSWSSARSLAFVKS